MTNNKRIVCGGIAALLLMVNCKKTRAADTDLDPCDPFRGYFKDGSHFIESDEVNEDGTLNKKTMFYRGKKKPCDPENNKLPPQRAD